MQAIRHFFQKTRRLFVRDLMWAVVVVAVLVAWRVESHHCQHELTDMRYRVYRATSLLDSAKERQTVAETTLMRERDEWEQAMYQFIRRLPKETVSQLLADELKQPLVGNDPHSRTVRYSLLRVAEMQGD